MKVLVAGSTGGTGLEVVKQLVAQNVAVTAIARDAEKAKDILPANAKIVQGNVLDASLVESAMTGIDAVVCALGPKNLLSPLEPYLVDSQGHTSISHFRSTEIIVVLEGSGNLVSAAEKANVRKFVLVSSIGVDITNPLFRFAFWGILYFKKQGEERLQNSTLDYTIVRPAGLRDEPKEGMEKANVTMYRAGARGWSGSILRADVARCCIQALTEPAATNKVVEILTESDAPSRSWHELFESVP